MGAFATAILWTWTALDLGSGQARATGPASTGTIVVHVAEDDDAAAHELGSLVQRHGAAGTPALRVEAPPAGFTRLAAARARCVEPTLGVFWLDATRPEEWRLYALPCATGRPLVREIVFPAGEEQAAIESAWLIVHSSAVAIAEGHGLAMREASEAMLEEPVVAEPATPPPPTAPIVPPPATPRRALGLRLSIAYAGAGLASALPWGHGAWGAIAWAPRPRLRLGAWYEFVAAGRLDEPAGFRLWRHAMAITIAAVIRFGGRWAIELRSGPELELSRWRSDAAGGRRRPIPRVGADATLSLGVGRVLTFDLGVGLAVPLASVDFVTCAGADRCSGADRRVVLDAWPVAPRARLGLSVQF